MEIKKTYLKKFFFYLFYVGCIAFNQILTKNNVMKKLLFLIVCFCLFTSSFATFHPVSKEDNSVNAAKIFIPIGKSGQEISLLDLSKISRADYQILTGKKLNFFERIMFKKTQKRLIKAINEDGFITDKRLNNVPAPPPSGGKSQLTALLLVIFVGVLGIHRFYLGYTWQGIVQLLTFGGFGIWALIDLVRIITGDLKPKDGEYEKTL